MHIPDGFIDFRTSLAAGVVAVGAVGVCVKQASKAIDDKEVPLAGLAAAFVFSVQMLNFPVASGTSGHLLGGALAAVLVGPWLGPLCVAVVLLVQALLFADGGLSALGLNIVNMSLISAWGGYLVFVVLRAALPRAKSSIVLAAGVAAGLAVPLAAVGFTVEYAIGGNDATSVSTVALAMVGVHVLIGIGEGLITAMTVSAVIAVRPDLVYGARGYAFAPIAAGIPVTTAVGGLIVVRRNVGGLVVVGLIVAVALAAFVSPFASSAPDGLEKVAADKSLDTDVEAHPLAGGPLADYGVEGVDNARGSTGLAGLIGVAVTFTVGFGLFTVIRRARVEPDPRLDSSSAAAGP